MDYSFSLEEFIKEGKDIEIEFPSTGIQTEYEYLNNSYNSMREVFGVFFSDLLKDISDEQIETIEKFIEENNEDIKDAKTAIIKIGKKEYVYNLGNLGTKAMLKKLKNDYNEISKIVGIQNVNIGEIILKNLKNDKKIKENGLMKGEKKVNIGKEIQNNKQVIFTGAPGTGKTWSVRKYVEDACKTNNQVDEKRFKFVQFHSSYDYTDFVEGLRPVPDGKGGNMFVRMDGTFKAFCRDIVKANLAKIHETYNEIIDIDSYYAYMQNGEKRDEIYAILDDIPYYFIIDEINRADLSRVFGELMFGLEESYREVQNRFDTQYKNLPTFEMVDGEAKTIENDCFKNGFFVPYNLHIVGTMNDIDRSVESFDFALRRRFVWIDVKANAVMFESLKSMRDKDKYQNLSDETLEKVSQKIITMNNKMTDAGYGLSEAYHIGPAYFKDLVEVSDGEVNEKLEEIFKNRIDSILREYTRGRRSDVETDLIEPCKIALLGKNNEQN